MSQKFIFTMQDLRKVAQGKEIIKGMYLSFYPGAKIGVIGPNGSGKSTLLRIMAGIDKDYMGEARPDPQAQIVYVPQEPELDKALTVRQNIELAVQDVRQLLEEFERLSQKFSEPLSDEAMSTLMDDYAKVQDKIEAKQGWEIDRTVELAMQALQLPDGNRSVEQLSGGEKRRVALCRALLQQPDMLLLDEPTNHLDAATVTWLEKQLKAFKGTIVCITHDRYFLDNVAQWILELERGEGKPFEGNYSAWLAYKAERMRHEERQASAKQKQLAEELAWVQLSQSGRQKKGKARLARYQELLDNANQQRELSGEICIPPGPPLGSMVIEAEGLSKAYDGKKLIESLDFKLPPAGIVGVIGANGAGKTTLFRLLVGEEQADAGVLRTGEKVVLSYVNQDRQTLDGESTVFEAVSQGQEYITLGNKHVNARSYLAGFTFRGADQQKKVKNLSGGERNRLHLACALKQEGNVLLLDEPTNDLDVETLRSLEQALQEFAGCAVIISHDRWFLDRCATHILSFEGQGKVIFYPGNFADYENDRQHRSATA